MLMPGWVALKCPRYIVEFFATLVAIVVWMTNKIMALTRIVMTK